MISTTPNSVLLENRADFSTKYLKNKLQSVADEVLFRFDQRQAKCIAWRQQAANNIQTLAT